MVESVTGELKAVAVKQDGEVIYKRGAFDPVKPGVLNPDDFKDAEYDWYEHCRRVNEKIISR